MDISNMKNMIVLKNLPSNLVDEAFIVLKNNKKIHKYQALDTKEKININPDCKNDNKDYIIKEAEMLIKSYTDNLEKDTPKSKNNIKKLEKRYKRSVKLNFCFLLIIIIEIIIILL